MIIGKQVIGKTILTKKDVKIDLAKLISTRLLIQANSGAGKSWLIRRLLEESHGKVQQIVLDLEGEFSTLREKYDYLLVGKGGEIPANIQTAELLAIKLLKLNVSTIIDLSELKHHERITFVKRFLDSLVNAPRELWHTCLVIVDEAHQFCPEKSKSESASSVIDLQTRGRKRGFCGVLATQRISKLHKDAAAECNNVLVGRTVLDIDRKRASDDLQFTTKEQSNNLKRLDDGEFFAYGPAISKDDVIKIKVGDVKTKHPEPGKSILKSSETPDNIKRLLKDVIDLPNEVEVELKTKKDFQNKILELKKELRITKQSQPKPIADEKALSMAELRGTKRAESHYIKEINSLQQNYKQIEKKLIDVGKIIGKEIPKYSFEPKTILKKEPIKVNYTKPNIPEVPQKHPISYESDTNKEIGICARKIYSFLYNHSERSFTKHHIGAFTGYSHKSGGFNNAVSQLNNKGLITRNGNSLQVKEMDSEIAGEFDFSKEAIMSNMGVCPKKIYQLLLDNPYETYSKENLGELTGYSHGSGGFNNAISKLNSLGLIIKDNSHIQLNPELLET